MVFSGCAGDNPTGWSEETVDRTEEFGSMASVRGSCNAIASKSTCIDYFGSFWTEQQMRLNCSGPGVTFSRNGCPYAELGGCNTGAGTIADAVLWHYAEGGQPFNASTVNDARIVCLNTPMAQWVSAEDK
jgi:hypothetical protein